MEWNYPSEEDLFQAENEKWNKIEKNIQELQTLNYFNPIENTLGAIGKIVNDKNFDRLQVSDEVGYYMKCFSCWAEENNNCHETCEILKLRSLVNTLGDMIA